MITEFGKALRKLRIDRGETLKIMADNLEMTSSYLSAIECGKRNIPMNSKNYLLLMIKVLAA